MEALAIIAVFALWGALQGISKAKREKKEWQEAAKKGE